MSYIREAIIIDLDGTLADVSPARKYVKGKSKNFEAFHQYGTTEAESNDAIIEIASAMNDCCFHYKVLLVSGRMEKWRQGTLEWLEEKVGTLEFQKATLLMRADNDYRQDVVVKREIYERDIKGKYDVRFAFDDNPNIVALWRELKIPVFQVPGWDDE